MLNLQKIPKDKFIHTKNEFGLFRHKNELKENIKKKKYALFVNTKRNIPLDYMNDLKKIKET